MGEDTDALKGHYGEQLIEGRVRDVQLSAISVYLEALYSNLALKKNCTNVFVEI